MAKRPNLKSAIKPKGANPRSAEMKAAAEGVDEMKRLNVNLPKSLHDELRDRAATDGHTLTWLIHRWAEDYLRGDWRPRRGDST